MSSRRSSSDRLGPSPSGRAEVMETGFSSRAATLLWAPRGAGGEVASRVSIAASVVNWRRTPPVPASQGRISNSTHVQTLVEAPAQILDGHKDLRRARVQKLGLGEPAREDADRANLGGL